MNFSRPRCVTLIDDDNDFRDALLERLQLENLDVQAFASAEAALKVLTADYPGVVVSDLRMPGMDGRGLLTRLQALDEGLPVVMITGHGDIADAVDALRNGAYDFVAKPFDFGRLADSLNRALEKRGLVLDNRALSAAVSRVTPDLPLLGSSPSIARLRTVIEQVADAGMDVLIEGETGVGKEVVARALHNSGRRRVHPFVPVNCGALPAGLIESELFGHEPGAFPGAVKRRVGLIEQSHRGTLFLDEIESMPMSAQIALLRVVEQREIQPLGASGPKQLDLRILASSKIDLEKAVSRGAFREDLYYRLNVMKLRVPPLRERRDDVPLLFAHFLARASGEHQRTPPPMSTAVRRTLMEHNWPGNVRELAHFADRIALDIDAPAGGGSVEEGTAGLTERLERFEKAVLEEALDRHAGDIVAITEALRIPRKTLYDKFRRHGLRPGAFRAREMR
ncbi:sigma-54 dependent transcriptional regulator [Brevundimonas sp. NIBR11]|uniref:sigma-54-dependent transcriptional regulator n=1 Tax=Brevundimonas sp. NIBR11 TaxID=3015999 RepID=UPI0022F02F92|nr:sigma-54 dependent transcriptional regulator [Brevundimonas sp. NIBR11]WGM30347.1 C4-dicarboxylate transport transcriptional regulatory protein DctD [Brevundimonas sp. NIBR11]